MLGLEYIVIFVISRHLWPIVAAVTSRNGILITNTKLMEHWDGGGPVSVGTYMLVQCLFII